MSPSIAVVVAHPDDEVIGVGAQLARWINHSGVTIVHVTDGAPEDGRDASANGFADSASYAGARRQELAAALALLPAPPRLVRLGFPDQRVVEELPALVDDLARLIRQSRPHLVVTHAYEGGHPDHDGLAVAIAALARNPDLPEFMHLEFAGYHEGAHGQLVTERFPDQPSCSASRVPLTPVEQEMKRRMLRCFSTQRRTLAPFRCEQEWLRQAPPYDFMTPPNQGRVWFDRYDFRVPRAAWCRHIQAVLPLTSGTASC